MEILHSSDKLFSDFQFIDNTDILVGTSHESVKEELNCIVDEMRKVKESPLHWVRSIRTSVTGNSNHRYSIPISIISNTTFIFYLRELGYYYLRKKFPNEPFKIGF